MKTIINNSEKKAISLFVNGKNVTLDPGATFVINDLKSWRSVEKQVALFKDLEVVAGELIDPNQVLDTELVDRPVDPNVTTELTDDEMKQRLLITEQLPGEVIEEGTADEGAVSEDAVSDEGSAVEEEEIALPQLDSRIEQLKKKFSKK